MNVSSISKGIGNTYNKIITSKNIVGRFFTRKFDQGLSDPARFAAAMLVTSIVSKDAIGCALYTSQSLNNKKIPEEKRPFVASLDLMNGIIMVGGQFLIGKVIDAKITPKLFGKRFAGFVTNPTTKETKSLSEGEKLKSVLDPNNIEELVKSVCTNNTKGVSNPKLVKHIQKIMKKENIDVSSLTSDAIKKISEQLVKEYKAGGGKYKAIETGFGLLVGAIATTAITKRTIAPLLSTPLAGWFKSHVMDKKKRQGVKKDRIYYEIASITDGKYAHKIDKTAFSNIQA